MATEREYLVGLGLAKPSRGRFSADAKAALAKAKAEGVVFDEPVGKPVRVAPPAKPVDLTRKSPAPTLDRPKSSPAPSRNDYDPKVVRKWAEERGLVDSGKRGRLPTEVLHKYASEVGARAPETKPKAVKPQIRTRPENHAWAFQAGDPSRGLSDIKIQFGDCANCRQRIGFCSCTDGPIGPKWLGSPVLSLTKP